MKAFFKDKRLFFFSMYIYVKKGTEKKQWTTLIHHKKNYVKMMLKLEGSLKYKIYSLVWRQRWFFDLFWYKLAID